MQTSQLLAVGFALLAAAIFAYVGYRLSRRPVSPDAQRAAELFAAWWGALAAATLTSAVQHLLAGLDRLTLPLHVVLVLFNILAICVALWGLMYYLLYVATGWNRSFWPLTFGYAWFFVMLVYVITASRPVDVGVEAWRVRTVFENPIDPTLQWMLVLLLILPAAFAALAYLFLFLRVHDRTQRYRILLVSLSILVWFMSPLVATLANVTGGAAWPIVSRLVGLLAAWTIFLAYYPPGWVRARLGVHGLEAPGSPGAAR